MTRLLRRRCTRRRGAGRDTLIPDAARRQRPAGHPARTRLRPQRSDLGSSRVSRPHPPGAVAGPHRWRANDHRRAAGPDASVAALEALVTDRRRLPCRRRTGLQPPPFRVLTDRRQTSATGVGVGSRLFRFLRDGVARRPVLPDPIRAKASSRVPGRERYPSPENIAPGLHFRH